MPEPIGERQQSILKFIQRFSNERGMPPTIKEIADHCSIAAPSAFVHLQRLEEAGYIKRTPKQWRSIRVVHAPAMTEVPVREMTRVPVVGRVAAGPAILAEQNIEDHIPVDPAFARGRGVLFALKVQGDSMTGADIQEGDYLIVRQQPVADSGDVVVALIGEKGTVKRLRISGDKIELVPENPRYKPIRIEQSEEFQVVGKALAVYRITNAPKAASRPSRVQGGRLS